MFYMRAIFSPENYLQSFLDLSFVIIYQIYAFIAFHLLRKLKNLQRGKISFGRSWILQDAQ